MASKAKVVVRPTSTICLPVGLTPNSVSVAKILQAAGLADSNGNLNSNVEAFRLVGGDFRASISASAASSSQPTSVRIAGGQTYELMDPYHAVKLRISDRNPLGFWKTETDGTAFTCEGVVDCVSFTIAVRFRQVSFQ